MTFTDDDHPIDATSRAPHPGPQTFRYATAADQSRATEWLRHALLLHDTYATVGDGPDHAITITTATGTITWPVGATITVDRTTIAVSDDTAASTGVVYVDPDRIRGALDELSTVCRAFADSVAEQARQIRTGLAGLSTRMMPRPTAPPPGAGAGPVSRHKPTLPGNVRMIEPPDGDYIPRDCERAVSLCGGIPGVAPWHDSAAVAIADRWTEVMGHARLAIICPRRRDVIITDGTVKIDTGRGTRLWADEDHDAQVEWEFRNVRPLDGVCAFWFPASGRTTPQPTSLVEFGVAWGGGHHLVIGAAPSYAYRYVLEAQAPRAGFALHDNLTNWSRAVVTALIDVAPASA